MGKIKDTTEIISAIKEYLGEGGCVAFEHGFRKPTFCIGQYKYKCTMVSDKVMYGYRCYGGGLKRTCNYALSTLNFTVLNGLYKAMKSYEEYCRNEA